MANKYNPILNFRNLNLNSSQAVDEKYDRKIGGRISSDGTMAIEKKSLAKKLLATLITETRESVDSSERS